MTSRTLTFVTGNVKKLEEVKAILSCGGSSTWDLVSKDIDWITKLHPRPDRFIHGHGDQVQGPVITEDTCLCFNALEGLPGPYIKWFLKKIGHKGLNNLLVAYEDKTAYAQCTFAYSPGEDKPIELFVGTTGVRGRIVAARGPHNFGWDPIFQPEGFVETYAEMKSEVKNNISHRSKALASLKTFLDKVVDEMPPESKKLKQREAVEQ